MLLKDLTPAVLAAADAGAAGWAYSGAVNVNAAINKISPSRLG